MRSHNGMNFFARTRYFLAIPAIAALLCGCTGTEDPVDPGKDTIDTVTGVISSPLTKVSGVDDSGTVSQEWEVGDVIYGYYGSAENIVKYKVASVDAEGVASFIWDGAEGMAPTVGKAGSSTFHLISDGSDPDFGDIPASGEYSVDLSSQTGLLGDALDRTVMAASGTVTGKKLELSFSNLTALLKVKAEDGFAVKGASAYHGLSATGTVSVNAGSMTFTPGGKGEISVTGSTSGSTAYIVIPASSIIGLEVWESNGTQERVAMSGTSRTAQPSKCYTFTESFEPRFHNSLPGLFSISSSDQVSFSKGSLQYRASTGTWRFAPNQYDIVGSGNEHIGSSCDGWIDLFGWGTSGQSYTSPLPSSPAALTPWSTSDVDSGYGPAYTSASEQYSYNYLNPGWHSDWGCNMPGFFTPSDGEWYYLFTRGGPDLYGGYATVAGIKGIILIPDGDFKDPEKNGGSGKFVYDNGTFDYSDNTYPAEDWAYMEIAGAVFLPCTGWREGTGYKFTDGFGRYWSNTGLDSDMSGNCRAGDISFDGTGFGAGACRRSFGLPVRLVCF